MDALNLSSVLRDVGQFLKACNADTGALELWHHSFAPDAKTHRDGPANSLSESAVDIRNMSQYKEAYKADREALDLRWHLFASSDTDVHRDKSFNTLHMIGVDLSELDQYQEASIAEQEAPALKSHSFAPDQATRFSNSAQPKQPFSIRRCVEHFSPSCRIHARIISA